MNTRQYDAEIKADYDLCINHSAEFQRKLDAISHALGLKGDDMETSWRRSRTCIQ